MTEDPIEHLRAALDRAEETAKAATSPGPWRVNQYDYDAEGFDAGIEWREPRDVAGHGYEGGGIVYLADAHHIAAWSPTVVLAMVEAERELLAEHAPDDDRAPECTRCGSDTIEIELSSGVILRAKEPVDWPCRTLLLRAKAWGWKGPE